MHIVNMMFARGGGGIEQAFVDYCEGLKKRGHQVTAIIYPGALVHAQLIRLSVSVVTLRNFNEWDIFAVWRLRRKLNEIRPDVIIAHANRAYVIGNRANAGVFPLVAVAHNYSTSRFAKTKALFTTTNDLTQHLIAQGVPSDRIHLIPNMVRCHGLPHRGDRNNPPVIGSMGRFVAKKGFDIYLEALSLLKDRGYKFRALLGGQGAEDSRLRALSTRLGLDDILTFTGWVEDKRKFYSGIDIFCLPSLHEPFGIVLLEAFTFGTPVVSSDSEGPRDIITPNYDAMMVKMGDALQLADALAKLLDDEAFANSLAANGFAKARMRYSLEVVSDNIEQALVKVIAGWNK